jgi:hypothetical protein
VHKTFVVKLRLFIGPERRYFVLLTPIGERGPKIFSVIRCSLLSFFEQLPSEFAQHFGFRIWMLTID